MKRCRLFLVFTPLALLIHIMGCSTQKVLKPGYQGESMAGIKQG